MTTVAAPPVAAEPSELYRRASESVAALRQGLPESLQYPKVAVVCGSGLGGLQDSVGAEPRVEFGYGEVPGFTKSKVVGHVGKLVFGVMGSAKTPVVLLVGRAHFFEGHSMDIVTFPTRVCKLLGVETMVVTNAAGGINPDYAVGDIVCLNDHINFPGFTGFGPLRGPNADDFGVRFPPLSDAYDLELRRRAHTAWKKLGLKNGKRRLHEGVYSFLAGPTYETRAECRMLRSFGTDVVGMSTVPEITVARHSGIRVLAFSLVTNCAVLEAGPRGDDPAFASMATEELQKYLSQGKADHEDVLQAGKEAARDMQALVTEVVSELYVS